MLVNTVVATSHPQDPRFSEVLSVAEATDIESMKKAVRKSRVVFNRGGADDQPTDPGVDRGRRAFGRRLTLLLLLSMLQATAVSCP
jgi:hypothetical protein